MKSPPRLQFRIATAMSGKIQPLASRQILSNDARGVSLGDLFIGEFYHLT